MFMDPTFHSNNRNCPPYVSRHGMRYKYTTEPMPQYFMAIYPPPYIQTDNGCVYKLENNNNGNNHHDDWVRDRNRDWNNRNNMDYDDRKPGKIYKKVTNNAIIYYSYERYPPNGPTQYLMPVIQRIIPRRDNDRDDNNFPYWGYPNYYPNYYYGYPPSQYPYYYPQPRPYPYPYPYPQYPYYPYGYRSRTFATTPKCVDKKDNQLSGILAWGCQVQEDWKNAGKDPKNSPNAQAGISGLDKSLRTGNGNQQGGVGGLLPRGGSSGSSGKGGGTSASTNCGGCDAGNIGCELGKLSCEFTKQLGNAGNSTFGVIGPYIPLIAIGGGALLLILLLKR